MVLKQSGSEPRVCLIARKAKGQIHWRLPKGHVEKGEELKQTALREVKEETGIDGSIQSRLGAIRYAFYDPRRKRHVFKTVHFYLVRYLRGSLADHDDEIESARWFPVSKALKLLEYTSERQLLRKAVLKVRKPA